MCYCRPEVRTPVCIGCVPFLAKEVQILQARLDRIIAAQRKTLDDIATR